MSRRSRIFYVGMITTDAYGAAIGEVTYSGAAARKMASVAHALRCVGRLATVVSLPFVGSAAKRVAYGPLVTSSGGVPTVFLPTLRSKYLRKIIGPFFVAAFLCRRSAAGDTVVVYNHAIEYILALLILRVRGVKLVQDIEDAPVAGEPGLRGFLNRLSFAVTFKLTQEKKMVVADHVAECLGLKEFVVIRGVAFQGSKTDSLSDPRKWRALNAGGELRLHFGGTLIPETGLDLFCEAVELLAQMGDSLPRGVHFSVTGIGDLEKIRVLQERINRFRRIRVDLLPALNEADYCALMGRCHGSLSLKRPESGISKTTFPSKVLEITSSGLALVSTSLGDVVSIFDASSAIFLSGFDARELAGVIARMAVDAPHVQHIANAGREICRQRFSPRSVGEEMNRLI